MPPLLMFEQPPHPLQIGRHVDSDRMEIPDADVDRNAVKQRPKLLQSLGALQRRLRQPREALQRLRGVAVEADVREGRYLAGGPRERDDRAREVERPAPRVEHDLDDLRQHGFAGEQGARERRHLRTFAHESRDLRDRAGIDQGLVPLDVQVRVGREVAGGLGDPLGAVATRGVGHQGAEPRGGDGGSDPLVVGGDRDLVDPFGPRSALRDPDDHRRPADVGEGLSGQSLGGVARGDQGCEAHVALYAAGPRLRNRNVLSPRTMDVLDEIRRAAFELRQTDPQEAVRILRKAAQQGGEAEVLARGALGEIYLDEFGDLDGAEHEFRRVLQLAPGLTAAEIGLGRTRREAGDVRGAETAFTRAIEGLSRDVRGFRETETLPEGVEEVVLTLLETAVELAELRKGAVPLDEELLAWAAAQKLFETEGDRDDWIRFHALWTRLRILTGRPEEAVTALREAERQGELPAEDARELLRLALAELGAPAVVQLKTPS